MYIFSISLNWIQFLAKANQWPCNDLIFTVSTLCTHPAVEEVWNRKSTASKIANRGRTPLHLAAWYGNYEVWVYFEEYKMHQSLELL